MWTFREIFREIEDSRIYSLKLANSAVYFSITFIIVAYTGHCWSASNAWDLGYHPTFSYEGMENLVDTKGWTAKRVAWVYLAPPMWGLLVAILSLVLYNFSDSRKVHLQTVLLWLSFNGFALYLSYVITGILSGQNYSSEFFTGFAGFYGWLEWSKAKSTAILCLQGIASLPFVLLYSKPVLQLNFSRLLATRKNGKSVIFIHVFVFPLLLGCLFVGVATFPMDINYQLTRMISCLFILPIIGLGMNLHKAKYITIVKGGLSPLPFIALFILIALLFASRLPLQSTLNPLW